MFRLFSDRWLSEEAYRELTPSVSEEKWNEVLQDSGFSGNDLVIHDYEEKPCSELSVLVSNWNHKIPQICICWSFDNHTGLIKASSSFGAKLADGVTKNKPTKNRPAMQNFDSSGIHHHNNSRARNLCVLVRIRGTTCN